MLKSFLTVLCFLLTLEISAQQLELLWKSDTLLRIPESVYYDEKSNLLFVSNIEGKSNEKDGKGFISRLTTDGKIQDLEWTTGLNAPKGMGLYKNKLYVADLTRIVEIDVSTGKISNTIEIDGAQFLNDITIDKKGTVFTSDSNTGKIYELSNGKSKLYFESKEFKRINGLLAIRDGLYIADAGNGLNYKLTSDKKLSKYTETAQGADGIVLVGKDEYIVSSWGGEVYFVGANGKSSKILDTKAEKLNSADIDYNKKTNTVYIPTFFKNCVMAYQFKK